MTHDSPSGSARERGDTAAGPPSSRDDDAERPCDGPHPLRLVARCPRCHAQVLLEVERRPRAGDVVNTAGPDPFYTVRT